MSKRFSYLFTLILLAVVMMPSTGCKKEKFITDSSAKLEFSEDTIIFDTVFTTVGSVTKYFRVHNKHNQSIRISSIALEKGSSSYFRLNVDGVPGVAFTDVEIPAQDSIFIFVEVTVDPTLQNNPLIITDQILFETNGNAQDVDLVAWGQDAYFYKPVSGSNSSAYVLPCNLVLANDKPHVFYGYAIVDSACCITIPAGTQLHFHPNSALVVYKGCLNATGNINNKIIFQGDRLEYTYEEVPAQWDGIRFIEAQSSYMEHCIVKNGYYGVWLDTIFSAGDQVQLNKVEIRNQASVGIYLNAGAQMHAENCLVKNCGSYAMLSTYGGDFDFNFCTFANYWTDNTRNTPAVYMTNWYEYNGGNIVRPLDAQFDNCIIYGSRDQEYSNDFKAGAPLNYVFSNCFIKTDIDLGSAINYINIFKNVDPQFIDASNHDFHIGISSPCIGQSNFVGGITSDLDDRSRSLPGDIGCYEH